MASSEGRSHDRNTPEGFYLGEQTKRAIRDRWIQEEDELATKYPLNAPVYFERGQIIGDGTVCGYDRDVRGPLVDVRIISARTNEPYTLSFTELELRKK